jgi:hypothetical protein
MPIPNNNNNNNNDKNNNNIILTYFVDEKAKYRVIQKDGLN